MFSFLTGSLGVTGARLVGAAAGFVTQLLLARMMLPDDLGIFYAAVSLAAVAALIASQGYPGIVQRFISRYQDRQGWRAAFDRQAVRHVFLAAVTATIAVSLGAWLWPGLPDQTRIVFAAGSLCILSGAAFNLFVAFANAQRRFGLAYLPETFFRPILFLVVTPVFAGFWGRMSSPAAAIIYALISGILALILWLLVRRQRSGGAQAVSMRDPIRRHWRREAAPLVIVALFTNAFADLAILGASGFLSSADLAHFGVAVKIAMLVGFVVQVAQQTSVPDLADAYAARDRAGARSAVLRSTIVPTLAVLAALVLAALAGDTALSLFGPSFVDAHWALVAMIAAQLARAAFGPGSHALSLHGEQAVNALACVAAVVTMIIGDIVLIPAYGITGAGLAVWGAVFTWIAIASGALWLRFGERVDMGVLLSAPSRKAADRV